MKKRTPPINRHSNRKGHDPDDATATSRRKNGLRSKSARVKRRAKRVQDGLITVRLSDIVTIPLQWRWSARFLADALILMTGDPEKGKSTFAAWFAAVVSTGSDWPDGAPNVAADVLLFSPEDPTASILRARFDAAGGDPSRVHVVKGARRRCTPHEFDLVADLNHLRRYLKRHPGIGLVVIDSLTTYMPDATGTESASRKALLSLTRIAEDFHLTVLAIMHPTKSANDTGDYRAIGSVSFTAVPRIVYALRETETGTRVLQAIKSNVRRPSTIEFQLVPSDSNPDVAVVRFIRFGGPEDQNGPNHGDPRTAYARASRFLTETLSSGPFLSKTVFERATAQGISVSTVRRIVKRLNICRGHIPTDKMHWYMWLPEHPHV